jgi:hypothetical protein
MVRATAPFTELTGSGTVSRRLQNTSTKWVDLLGLERTAVETTSIGKH